VQSRVVATGRTDRARDLIAAVIRASNYGSLTIAVGFYFDFRSGFHVIHTVSRFSTDIFEGARADVSRSRISHSFPHFTFSQLCLRRVFIKLPKVIFTNDTMMYERISLYIYISYGHGVKTC